MNGITAANEFETRELHELHELKEAVEDLWIRTRAFADFCEFAYFAKDCMYDTKVNERYGAAVMRIIQQEAARIEEEANIIYNNV